MKLSAPVHVLKREAKAISRQEGIALHNALDRVARREGYKQWSLLVDRASAHLSDKAPLPELKPGDLLLLGARPRQGKTLLSLELLVAAMRAGHRGAFFTLECVEADMLKYFAAIGVNPKPFQDRFYFDNSDAINASYIIDRLQTAPKGTVVVIDYLQLLDQKRENPELMDQVRDLKVFAHDRGLIVVFLSQIDRSYEPGARPCPALADVRLPNPLDLRIFSKACFLNNGQMRIQAVN